MTTRLLGTYRGFRIFEAVDELGKPTGLITVEGLDETFTSVAAAQAAVDAHLARPEGPRGDEGHDGEPESDEPPYESPDY